MANKKLDLKLLEPDEVGWINFIKAAVLLLLHLLLLLPLVVILLVVIIVVEGTC
jgi:hypothetical protein